MVETVQRAALVAAYASGLVWMLLRRRLRGSSLTIFFYQGVSRLEAGDFGPARRRFVTPENFRQQVRFFKKHFTPVLLRDGVAWLEGGPKEGRPMASIVFHDGYRNIFTEAFPTLEAEGVPFTVCCTSGLIGNEQTPWWERLEQAIRVGNKVMTLRYGSGERRYDLRTARGKWRLYHHACRAAEEIPSGHPDEVVDDLVRQMGVPAPERPGDAFMNWQEVGILGRHPLVELGSHTVNHSVTPRLSLGVLWRELVDSKSRIEKEAEVRVSSFAYPYGRAGDYPPEVFPLLQQAGYRCAVTAGEGPNPPTQHPFELKRVPIDGTDSWPVFVTKAAGMMFR